MIGPEDSIYTYEYDDYFKILPSIHNWSEDQIRIGKGVKVKAGFLYSSDNNSHWMEISDLQQWIKKNKDKIGNI